LWVVERQKISLVACNMHVVPKAVATIVGRRATKKMSLVACNMHIVPKAVATIVGRRAQKNVTCGM